MIDSDKPKPKLENDSAIPHINKYGSIRNYSKYDLVKLLLTNKISYRTRLFIHMKNISSRYHGITNFAESDDNIVKSKLCELTKVHKEDYKERIVKQLIIAETIEKNPKIYIRGSCNINEKNNSKFFIDLNACAHSSSGTETLTISAPAAANASI